MKVVRQGGHLCIQVRPRLLRGEARCGVDGCLSSLGGRSLKCSPRPLEYPEGLIPGTENVQGGSPVIRNVMELVVAYLAVKGSVAFLASAP